MKRWLGIDFSGDNSKWTGRCTRSNVWIADVRFVDYRLALYWLARVQAIPDASIGKPFLRLAAALRVGDLPFQGHNENSDNAIVARRRIVDLLSDRIELDPCQPDLPADADALDAVLCAFAAIAVTDDRLGELLPLDHQDEGCIAVHE